MANGQSQGTEPEEIVNVAGSADEERSESQDGGNEAPTFFGLQIEAEPGPVPGSPEDRSVNARVVEVVDSPHVEGISINHEELTFRVPISGSKGGENLADAAEAALFTFPQSEIQFDSVVNGQETFADDDSPEILGSVESQAADDAPRVKNPNFFRVLKSSTAGLVDPENQKFLMMTPAIIAGAAADDAVENYFRNREQGFDAGTPWEQIGQPSFAVYNAAGPTLWLAAKVIGLDTDAGSAMDEFGTKMMVFTAINEVTTRGVKAATGRERPNGQNKKAFYSGHVSTSCGVSRLIADGGWKRALVAYGATAAVVYQRLAKGKHHVSDVVAGCIAGTAVAETVDRRYDRLKAEDAASKLRTAMALLTSGKEISVGDTPVTLQIRHGTTTPMGLRTQQGVTFTATWGDR